MLEGFDLNGGLLDLLNLLADHVVLSTDQVEDLHVLFLGKGLPPQVNVEEVGLDLLADEDRPHLSNPPFAVPQDLLPLEIVLYPDLLDHELLPKQIAHPLLLPHHFFSRLADLDVFLRLALGRQRVDL